MASALVKSMLENSVHIGHKREYWSPKMRDYIYGVQNGIHIFDLYKTEEKLEEMKKALKELTEKGQTILFVGTKVQTRDLVSVLAKETGHFYLNSKWVPGLLTNFSTIKKRIAYYNQLEKDLESGIFDTYKKKERAVKMKELEKLRMAYVGVKDMKKIPEILFVVDGRYEELALTEAKSTKMTRFALLGSTGDIDKTDYFVPCNVNSINAIAFILGELKPHIAPRKTEERAFQSAPRMERMAPKGQPRRNNASGSHVASDSEKKSSESPTRE